MKKEPPESLNLPSTPQEEKWSFPFSRADWENTPKPVKDFIVYLINNVSGLEHRIFKLESRLKQDSKNSNRPPSSDNPYKKPSSKKTPTLHHIYTQAVLILTRADKTLSCQPTSPLSLTGNILIFIKPLP